MVYNTLMVELLVGFPDDDSDERTGHEIIQQAELIVQQAQPISRRKFLSYAGFFVGGITLSGGIGAVLLGQDRGERADLLTDEPEFFTEWEKGADRVFDASTVSPSSIDEDYVVSLFDQLSTDRGAGPNKKIKAVLDNASIVFPKDRSALGSAVRICESGYFITVAHNFLKLDKNGITMTPFYKGGYEIFNPATGMYSTVRSVLLAANEDLAIAYAPTNLSRKAVNGLKLDFNPPLSGQRLWNVALTPEYRFLLLASITHGPDEPVSINFISKILMLGIVSGNVGRNSIELSSRTGDFRSKSILVEGLKPYGGSSGCATVNGLGEVVAIEQGADRGNAENERANYAAAEVGPLYPLREKLQRFNF